ncbi:glycosyltransferase family 4 protein [Melioribacter sp. OK-6-Me]|uniref:glycosyltransferase family 4 protein n=1 Tax=unclassified Melioribacter TaxID=2627329 RepID=UPI003EDB2A88
MRVCFIGRYYHEFVTAPIKYSKVLYRYIHADYRQTIFITYFFDSSNKFKKLLGSKTIASGVYKCGILIIIFRLLKYKPALVHFTTLERFEIPLFIVCKILGIKIISTLHGLFYKETENFNKITNRIKDLLLERTAIKHSDFLLIYSQYQAEMIIKKYFIKHSKLKYTYNGIDIFEKKNSKPEFKNKLMIVFYKGFGKNDRGLNKLIELLMCIKGTQLNLTVLGSSDGCINHKFGNLKIRYAGFLSGDELSELFNQSHLIIKMPSFETFSTIVIESMSYGVVPVVPDFIGASRFITNGKNGLKYHATKPEALREIIQKIVDGGYDLTTLSKNAFNTAKEFTWEKMAEHTKDIYEELLR